MSGIEPMDDLESDDDIDVEGEGLVAVALPRQVRVLRLEVEFPIGEMGGLLTSIRGKLEPGETSAIVMAPPMRGTVENLWAIEMAGATPTVYPMATCAEGIRILESGPVEILCMPERARMMELEMQAAATMWAARGESIESTIAAPFNLIEVPHWADIGRAAKARITAALVHDTRRIDIVVTGPDGKGAFGLRYRDGKRTAKLPIEVEAVAGRTLKMKPVAAMRLAMFVTVLAMELNGSSVETEGAWSQARH